ncbi:MAG: hypothetical protein UX04_C0005G0053 [Microgenomates group bacterium GW2011_GWF2_45_18]|nr:MAG: hypothetical protein UW18_C0007G0053 [Microgenomates group bacterium GW2011_GWF1_44_10]KKU01634.1 MAG: hypothetical protein UX04_C0005G0053 [Microgenomates group bacterium GW2011_GWF2_45_18]OGJ41299.1 MAG: hypothetical protein A2378_04305 [Candidatus Pacebacteria bacterium RIFOXYB1_FULL_44_10]HAU99484.1 hypothetical protein [Candidatus Paceibacterota bacterium]HAX01455.1 hypothetical protein [Candidatus Paceibacterota bacterium]
MTQENGESHQPKSIQELLLIYAIVGGGRIVVAGATVLNAIAQFAQKEQLTRFQHENLNLFFLQLITWVNENPKLAMVEIPVGLLVIFFTFIANGGQGNVEEQ